MQKFISKYGLAAHLALLAVAPLFLFPFCGPVWIGRVLLWLSLFAVVWVLMEPSRRAGEMSHDARFRVASGIVRDPLFWFLLALIVMAFLRGLNDGVAMFYDAETLQWSLTVPLVKFFPGCVKGAGFLSVAVVVAALPIVMGCRHALGRSARMAYLLISSVLAGIAALAAAVVGACGSADVCAAARCSLGNATYAGLAFGIHFLSSIVALVGMFENKWKLAMPLALVGTGGTALGLFVFSPLPEVLIVLAAAVLILAFSLSYLAVKVRGLVLPKCLILFSISLAIPVLFVIGILPAEIRGLKLAFFSDGPLFPADFDAIRGTLSAIAQRAWENHPWVGSGIGSFALDIRFNAVEADWSVIPPGQAGALNGWWQLLAERGIVGALMLVTPLLFLFWTYGVRLVAAVRGIADHGFAPVIYPMGFLGLAAVAVAAVCGFGDFSFCRPEAILAIAAVGALSGSSLPAVRRQTAEKTEN